MKYHDNGLAAQTLIYWNVTETCRQRTRGCRKKDAARLFLRGTHPKMTHIQTGFRTRWSPGLSNFFFLSETLVGVMRWEDEEYLMYFFHSKLLFIPGLRGEKDGEEEGEKMER